MAISPIIPFTVPGPRPMPVVGPWLRIMNQHQSERLYAYASNATISERRSASKAG